MSDILADYREWRSQQEERIGTHSDGCHMWPRHERCMIHRLADEIARLRLAICRLAEQDATLSACDGNVTVEMDATLTDAEREALTVMMGDSRRWGETTSQIVRGLLERLGGGR